MRWLEQLRAHGRHQPPRVAIGDGAEVLTYGELQARADGLALRLRAAGVGAESLVAVLLPRGAARLVATLAVVAAGAAYLPLGERETTDRQAAVLRDAAPEVVLSPPALAGPLAQGAWRLWTISGWDDLPPMPAHQPMAAPGPDDLAYVIYTSGSTGDPKGVEIEHGALEQLIAWHRREYQVTPADRAALLAYPGFDAAVWELWPYWAAGASVHVAPAEVRLIPEALRDWLVAQRISVAFAPTPLAEQLIAIAWPGRPPLRALFTGGDRLRRRPPATLPFPLFNHYGPTEATVVSTHGRVAVAVEGLPALGRPVPHLRLEIRDECQRPVPAGGEGEIWIAGRALARGYRHDPELTAARFCRRPGRGERPDQAPSERWYRSGDRGRWRPDGELDFLGRTDRQLKIRGWRIEPAEIERQLLAHPAVAAAVVERLPAADGDGEQAVLLVAYLVARAAQRPGLPALRAFLRARLPEPMLPSQVRWLRELPQTAPGKWDRAALARAEALDSDVNPPGAAAPALSGSPTTRTVTAILAALLGVPRVQAEEDFFLLGGHSLLGVQLVARLRDELGVVLPLRAIFDHPTAAGLAAIIDHRLDPRRGAPPPLDAAAEAGQGAGR